MAYLPGSVVQCSCDVLDAVRTLLQQPIWEVLPVIAARPIELGINT